MFKLSLGCIFDCIMFCVVVAGNTLVSCCPIVLVLLGYDEKLDCSYLLARWSYHGFIIDAQAYPVKYSGINEEDEKDGVNDEF